MCYINYDFTINGQDLLDNIHWNIFSHTPLTTCLNVDAFFPLSNLKLTTTALY